MQISPKGIALIERNEGFRPNVYDDNGKKAIGFGHDIAPGEADSFSAGISLAQAQQLLLSDLVPVQEVLQSIVPPTCTQNQWDALCDFGYNLGVGSLKTMLGHGWDQVPIQIPRWNHENGVVVAGLAARREAEVALFNTA